MVWLDLQFEHLPAHLGAFPTDDPVAVLCDPSDENFLPAARAPHEMVGDQVNATFVSLVVHYVDIVVLIYKDVNKKVRSQRLRS